MGVGAVLFKHTHVCDLSVDSEHKHLLGLGAWGKHVCECSQYQHCTP